jgi:diketogulonate reductase-like aldo/keto reductase
MEYRPLGRTGVQVSKLCLGTMMFGAWGNADHDDSIRIIHRALDAGINFVDTADVYSAGESEEIVGKAIKGRRDDIVLATKFFSPMGDDPNRRGASRRWIVTEVENSLRRLGTDWIDLYQVHRPDPETDIDETLGALTDLVQQGKVRYIGSSSFSAGEIVDAQWAARERNLQRFRTEQPPYSLLVRGIELDVLPTARDSTCRCPTTSASSKPSSSWPGSPTKPVSRSSSSRSPSSSTTRRSRRPSSARAPWSSSTASCPPPTSRSTPRCSTASTRSSPPASPSTPPTTATATTSSSPPCAGADARAQSRP